MFMVLDFWKNANFRMGFSDHDENKISHNFLYFAQFSPVWRLITFFREISSCVHPRNLQNYVWVPAKFGGAHSRSRWVTFLFPGLEKNEVISTWLTRTMTQDWQWIMFVVENFKVKKWVWQQYLSRSYPKEKMKERFKPTATQKWVN